MICRNLHLACSRKGLLSTLGPTSLKEKIYPLIKCCTLAFSAKQLSRSWPASPSWNSQWALRFNPNGGEFIREVSRPSCNQNSLDQLRINLSICHGNRVKLGYILGIKIFILTNILLLRSLRWWSVNHKSNYNYIWLIIIFFPVTRSPFIWNNIQFTIFLLLKVLIGLPCTTRGLNCVSNFSILDTLL